MARYVKGGSGMDLSGLDIEELETLRAEIDKRLTDLKETREKEAFARLDEMAKTLGLDGAAIAKHFGKAPRRAKGSTGLMYRNPKKPEQTWSGRGRKPAWVQAHLDGGGDLKSLEAK